VFYKRLAHAVHGGVLEKTTLLRHMDDDFQRDCRGKGFVSHMNFGDSIYEMAVVWVEDGDEEFDGHEEQFEHADQKHSSTEASTKSLVEYMVAMRHKVFATDFDVDEWFDSLSVDPSTNAAAVAVAAAAAAGESAGLAAAAAGGAVGAKEAAAAAAAAAAGAASAAGAAVVRQPRRRSFSVVTAAFAALATVKSPRRGPSITSPMASPMETTKEGKEALAGEEEEEEEEEPTVQVEHMGHYYELDSGDLKEKLLGPTPTRPRATGEVHSY
jgi:hypothetical protein